MYIAQKGFEGDYMPSANYFFAILKTVYELTSCQCWEEEGNSILKQLKKVATSYFFMVNMWLL